MNLRRFVAVVWVTLAITAVTVMVGLVTNVASSQGSWPGWLELMRQHPWQALGILAGLAMLFGVLAALLPTSPEPPRTPAVAPAEGEHDLVLATGGMLPPDMPNFTGRQEELRQLVNAAERSGGRVLAVTGMPGAGKTALVVRAAHLLADRFTDGRIFIDLHAHTAGQSPVTTSDALARLLSAVGVPAQNIPTGPDIAAVTEQRAALWRARLSGRRMLVVLDNAAGSEQVRPLLPGSARCLVLVTSRRRLAMLPATPVELDMLSKTEAAQLFTRVAGRQVEAGQQPALAELMRLCGFLPLAIALLASWLRQHPAWSITDLVQRMRQTRDRLAELHAEDLAVAAAFELTYQDLPVERQRFFRRLGTHPGPDIDAYAAAALHDVPVTRARALLDDLYNEHLLIEGVAGRHRMHDLVGEYARSLSADTQAAEDEHGLTRLFDYYQHTAARASWHLQLQSHTGPEPQAAPGNGPPLSSHAEAIAWLDAERANLLACIAYATEHAQPARVVALVAALADHMHLSGPWDQAITLHTTAVSCAKHLNDRLGEANALNQLGIVQYMTDDYPAAAESQLQALALCRELGDRLGEANALTGLGAVQRLTSDYAAAADSLLQALALYRDLGDRLGQANALNLLGFVQYSTGDYPAAGDGQRRALTISRDLGDRLGEANALNTLGAVQRLTSDYPAAAGSLQRALALYRDLGDRLGEANALNTLGAVQRLTSDYPAAAGSLQRALALCRELGDRLGEAEALNNLGTLDLALSEPRQAMDNHRHALTLARKIHSRMEEAHGLEGIGRCAFSLGDLHETQANLRQALELYQRMGAAVDADRVASDLTYLDLGPQDEKAGRTL